MQAIVYEQYGPPDVLELRDIDKPIPSPDQLLVRVHAAAVNPYDWHFMRGEPYFMRIVSGLRRPKAQRLGLDFAGEVESVGANVEAFQPGDAVYGMEDGAFAEYLAVDEKYVAKKPESVSFEHAAAVPLGALTALQGLRDAGKVAEGQRVLIIGASGGVGTFAVQLAKLMGAHVTGVCSGRNAELVRSLGADEVIDYTIDDFTEGDTCYDVILQLAGMETPGKCRRALTPKGRLVLSSGDSDGKLIGPLGNVLKAVALSPFVPQALVNIDTQRRQNDLIYMAELIDAGKIRITIDRTVSLEEVPDAIRYVETGRARGKVVVDVAGRPKLS